MTAYLAQFAGVMTVVSGGFAVFMLPVDWIRSWRVL